jgi:hypothetical protein
MPVEPEPQPTGHVIGAGRVLSDDEIALAMEYQAQKAKLALEHDNAQIRLLADYQAKARNAPKTPTPSP